MAAVEKSSEQPSGNASNSKRWLCAQMFTLCPRAVLLDRPTDVCYDFLFLPVCAYAAAVACFFLYAVPWCDHLLGCHLCVGREGPGGWRGRSFRVIL